MFNYRLLNALLIEKKLSKIEFAKMIDVHPVSVSHYATGKYQPTLKTYTKICICLNISLDLLVVRDHSSGSLSRS